ncbi:hypothetical protein HY643_05360 [Candidatus Woesearchaeota archaeon]|nr:hypothetical protein [Candidatus Woesearchaeota archaeon]
MRKISAKKLCELLGAEEISQPREDKEFWEKENQLLEKKKSLYGKIFEWKGRFIQTEQFNKLLNKPGGTIDIYCGHWGHEQNYGNCYGCWSIISLDKSGEMFYNAGYKAMPGPRAHFKLNEESLEKLTYAYIKAFYKEIKKGKVDERITKQLKK